MNVQHAISFFDDGDAFIAMIRVPLSSSSSGPLRHQITPAHQVVRGGAEGEDPIDESSATVPQLAEQRDGLQPAKRLLNELPLAMTDAIADVSGRTSVDGAAAVS